MIGFLFSILFAILIYFIPVEKEIKNLPILIGVIISSSFLLALLQGLISLFAWGPLLRGEEKGSSRLIETYLADKRILLSNALLLIFILFSIFFVIDQLFLNTFNKSAMFIGWALGLGLACDLIYHITRRTSHYLDPFFALEQTATRAKDAIQGENQEEILKWIDSLSETALRATIKSKIALAEEALDQIKQTTEVFINAVHSIGHHIEEGKQDRVGYTLFYLYQRLELVFEKALDNKLEPILSKILSIFGRLSLFVTKIDITLTTHPLKLLGKLANEADRKGFSDVSARAVLLFVEIGRELTQEIDITHLEIKDPFIAMIQSMKEIAKLNFKNDKTLPIAYLQAPFMQMKSYFQEGKAAQHQDKDVIVRSIDSILEEFKALEEILKTVPDLSKLSPK
jgi:hypothetical protein